MKKQLLQSFLGFLLLFSVSVFAQPGMTCSNPISISALPYQDFNNTANFSDTFDSYQGISCGTNPVNASYTAGNDVFYSFQAAADGIVNVTLESTGLTFARSAVFLYDGCSNVGVSCIGGAGSFDSSIRYFTANVLQGHDYIVLVSSGLPTQTMSYNLLIQSEDCSPEPFNLGADNITLNSAHLFWDTQAYSSWEVAVQPSGSLVPSAHGIAVNAPEYNVTDLNPGSQYQYWVRGECTAGTDIWTAWAGPFQLNTQICESSQACNYTFRISNTTTAGWGTNRMQVRQNGIVVATLGSQLPTGIGPVDIVVPLCNNVPFDLYWSTGGGVMTQKNIKILNSFGQTIYTKPTGLVSLNAVLYSDFGSCDMPECDIPPTNVTVSDITPYTATINWTAPATTSWDVYITEAGASAPIASTVPTYNDLDTLPSLQITGLTPDHCYDVYVRVNCSPAPSAWSVLSAAANFCTIPTCYKPTNTAVMPSGITTTSAVFTWDPGSTADTQFELILIPGPNLPTPPDSNTPATYVVNIPPGGPYTYTATDLEPATIYYAYVRTRCSPTDVSNCVSFPVFNTVLCNNADKCNYKFILTGTSDGNTWNNGRMQIRQNGIIIATIGLSGVNDPNGVSIALCNGIPFDVFWNIGGSLPEEIGLSVRNPFNDVIYEKPPGTGSPFTVLYSSIANCLPAPCSKPININVTNITHASATVSWTDISVPTAPEYAMYIVPTGGAAPLNDPATPATIYPVTNPFTISEATGYALSPSASYTFYVKSVCSDTAESLWPTLNPTTFITTPANDLCINAIPVMVNAGQACIPANSVHGNTYGGLENVSDAPQGTIGGCGTTNDDIWYKFTATANMQIINFYNVTGTPQSAAINHSVYSGSCGNFTELYCSADLSSNAMNLTAGEIYYIRVYTLGTAASQFVDFDMCITSQPVNDECVNALNVQVNPLWMCNPTLSTPGNTLGATASPATFSTCGNSDDDVWFRFVATNSIHVISINDIVQVNGTSVVWQTLCSGTPDNLVKIYCTALAEKAVTGLTVGETYYIRVYTAASTAGKSVSFNVCVSTPPAAATNDECATAINVEVNTASDCIYTTQGSIIGATGSTGIPGSCQAGRDDDVWFTFTAASAAQVISLLNVHGTTTNLNHAVYSGTCSGLTLKYCSAANELISGSSTFVPGQTYYLRVWSNVVTSEVSVFDVCVKSISTCENAVSFCGSSQDDPYIFSNTVGVANQTQIACLGSTPNPVYYKIHVSESGNLVFNILQNTLFNQNGEPTGISLDVDFAAWGPFETASVCEDIVFADCPSCPNNTTNQNFYPFGNIVDCSYDASFTETLTIPNAQAGAYYMVLITNFNGDAGYIRLTQTNLGQPGAGSTVCVDKIRLIAYVDANANGIKDAGEINFTEGNFIYQKNDAGPLGNISSVTGVYDIYAGDPEDSFDFTYQIFPEYTPYYNCPAPGFSNVTIQTDGGSQLLYFPINITQAYNDVSITIVPNDPPIPGFTHSNKIVYKNKGLQPVSGTITFQKDPAVSITNVTDPGIIINSSGFTYNFAGLQPQESGVIYVNMIVPGLPEVTLGQLLTGTASITIADDIIPVDNNATIVQTVIGSYDPNDKTESHAGEVNIDELNNGGYLFYTIRFQNTGTYKAFNVRLEDTLDEMLDETSIRVLSASHSYDLLRTDHQLIWHFDDINLPSAAEDEEASHGYVTFKIKPKPGYAVGDIISNTAEIYFDTNPAIVTNTVETEVSTPLGTDVFDISNIVLYPNPANTIVYLNLQHTTETLEQVTLYDVLGKAVKTVKANHQQQATLDVSALAKGVYLVEIKTMTHLKLIRKLVVN